MSDLRLSLAAILPKIRRRLPGALAKPDLWLRGQDRLIAGHYLQRSRRAALESAWQRCESPADFFEFAGGVFPAHQIREEILGFLALARTIQPATVMEIGTAQGGTNFLLGATLPSVTLKLGVDLFVQNQRLLRTFHRPGCRQEFLNGSSYAPETRDRVSRRLAGRKLDVLFIDGDHTEEGVRADFEAYCPFVRPGGLVAFHDIVPDHLTRFGRKTGRWAGGVPNFWQKIRAGFPQTWEFVADREQDGLGIGAGRLA